MENSIILILSAFVISTACGFIIIPHIVNFCIKKNLYDIPNARKVHSNAVPRLGGVAFVPSMLIAFTIAVAVINSGGRLISINLWSVYFLISILLGNRFYPIPYRWSRIALIFIAMLGIFWGSEWIDRLFFSDIAIGSASAGHIIAKLGVHTALIAVYIGLAYLIVRQRPATKRKEVS